MACSLAKPPKESKAPQAGKHWAVTAHQEQRTAAMSWEQRASTKGYGLVRMAMDYGRRTELMTEDWVSGTDVYHPCNYGVVH